MTTRETRSESDEIACPWCGARVVCLDELGLRDGGRVDVDCEACDRACELSMRFVAVYTARRAG
jgi:hypothetical protein